MDLEIVTGGTEPAADLLATVAAGERGSLLRLLVPAPTVAFGRLDALRDGFADAQAVARRHGFAPHLRAPGGHAAAFHDGCLVVEEIVHEADAVPRVQDRFRERGDLLAGALRTLGVDARVGELPREYCAGRHSINARGRVKLVGTAQRVVRGGWLFGSVITVTGTAALRAVLTDVYAALDIDMDPATIGGVADEVPGVSVEDVRRAVITAYATVGGSDA